MLQQGFKYTRWLLAVTLLLLALGAQAASNLARIGVLVVAPDRGFMGNEEVREAFASFVDGCKAELLFVTDERSEAILDQRLRKLDDQGAKQLLVLPLVTSRSDARWQLAQAWLAKRNWRGNKIHIAQAYGDSYLAVEDLSQRLRNVSTHKSRLLLVGYGAKDAAAAQQMRADLLRKGAFASRLPASQISAVVYPLRQAEDHQALLDAFEQGIKQAGDALVVTQAMAPRSDSMMVFARWFAADLPASAKLLDTPVAESAALTQWMQLAFNQASLALVPPRAEEVGVVVLAHGADWFWNQAIRDALVPLAKRHPVAYAFTMADQPVIAAAVDHLDQQPLRAIIVVRAFGMASSFRSSVERMLGQDVRVGDLPAAAHEHDMGMAMMHGMHDMEHGAMQLLFASPRIRAQVPLLTLGGVEDNALFARALLANARAVSTDAAKETLILVAHGAGDDQDNDHWLSLLASLGKQMQAQPGYDFKALKVATWREDWPDKNKLAVAQVRAWVQDINAAGGRALIVPARINGRGAAGRYLQGLKFGWGQGFVQTPYFSDWFEQQVQQGIAALNVE